MKPNICKNCGEDIELSQNTKELIEEGYLSQYDCPEICEDCSNFENDYFYEQFSDADPGL